MRTTSRQQGFTLIELMVGVVLGMLTMLVIAQVMVQSESRKRTISMGSDAQINGSLALFAVQRDVQMSGYGISLPDVVGCNVHAMHDAYKVDIYFTLAPVVITDGTDGAPDTITVLYARTHDFSVPIKTTGQHSQTDNVFNVSSSLGVSEGDMMIVAPGKGAGDGGACAMFTVKGDPSSSTARLTDTRIPHVSGPDSKWNLSSVFPEGGFDGSSFLLNMGQIAQRSYTVNSAGSLVSQELSPVDGTQLNRELFPQIVNLQAMYGKDTNEDGKIDLYDTIKPATSAQWAQVKTVRIAVVARSEQYEKDAVTTSAPQWDVGSGATISGPRTTPCNNGSQCVSIKVDHLDGWQHYRYKVYETIVPLRNILWNS